MNRPAIGTCATAAIMATAVLLAPRRDRDPGPASDAEPDRCLSKVIEASRSGDVATYLECFTGALRERLEAEAAASRPAARFAETLQSGVAGLKATVVSEVTEIAPGEATLLWEHVHASYNARYRVRLRLVEGRWRIDEMARVDRRTPEIPYGTPVFGESPVPTEDDRR